MKTENATLIFETILQYIMAVINVTVGFLTVE
jgi:hypothetical protein